MSKFMAGKKSDATRASIPDEAVEAALAAWYPGEWPQDTSFIPGAERFADCRRSEMRDAIEAALPFLPARPLTADEVERATNALVAEFKRQSGDDGLLVSFFLGTMYIADAAGFDVVSVIFAVFAAVNRSPIPVPDAEPDQHAQRAPGRTAGATPATGANSADQVGRVRDAIISTMFAPHELPLTDDRLLMNYTRTAKAAIAAMNRMSIDKMLDAHGIGQECGYDDGLRRAAEIARNLPTLEATFPGIPGNGHVTIHGEKIAAAILAELGKPEGEKG